MSSAPEYVTIFRHPYLEDAPPSHHLLRQAAMRCSGLSDAALGAVERQTYGKPFFPNQPDLHFSITHSGDWWLCGFSRSPLGLDLQIHHSHVPPSKLSQRFFHPNEDAFLSIGNYARFYDLWCAKESWVKYTGTGFYTPPESFSVVSSSGKFPSLEGVSFRLMDFEPGYSLCLCTQQNTSWRLLEL